MCAESVLCAMEGKEIRTEYWAFPTIEQLQAATESGLREAGFGYRAKYIVGAAALLAAHPAGTCRALETRILSCV